MLLDVITYNEIIGMCITTCMIQNIVAEYIKRLEAMEGNERVFPFTDGRPGRVWLAGKLPAAAQ